MTTVNAVNRVGALARVLLTFLTLCLTQPGMTATPEITLLGNGAKLVTLYDPTSPVVVINVFFRVGMGDEVQKPGMTALITRAWFSDGRYRSANQLRRDISTFGSGVGSSFEGSFAEIWSVSESSQSAVEQSAQTLLLNLVASPGFSPEAVTAAKDEQLRAMALTEGNPLTATLNRLRGRVWFESPQGRPLLGTAESVSTITPKEVQAYYTRFFRPARAVIVIAGNITSSRARRLVEQNLNAAGWSETGRPDAPETLPAPERVPPTLRDVTLGRTDPASVFAIGYLAPGTQANSRSDWATLLVLDTVLGGGKASRLFRLRDEADPPEEPVGYEIRTQLFPSRSQSLWAAYVIGNNPTATTRARVLATLSALGTGKEPVTEKELARAKAYLKGKQALARQQWKDQSHALGRAEMMGLGAEFETDYDSLIDAVEAEDVTRLARQIFGDASGAVVSTQ
ncbi:MAG: pitrilysin family protein [Armatimonadota bacterium]